MKAKDLLLELMRPEDAAAVHANFLKMHREGLGYGVEYSFFAKRWGKIDGAGALEFLMNEKPLRLPPQDIHNIAYGWAQTDPVAALLWMDEHPELATSHSGWSTIIAGWIGRDPTAATAYLQSHFLDTLQPKWPAETASAQFARWHEIDPERVDKWLAEAPSCEFTETIRRALQTENPEAE